MLFLLKVGAKLKFKMIMDVNAETKIYLPIKAITCEIKINKFENIPLLSCPYLFIF